MQKGLILKVTFTLLLIMAPVSSAHALQPFLVKLPQSTTCEWYFSTYIHKTVNYCVDRSRPDLPRKSGEPVVYFMHTLTGDAKSWVTKGYAEALESLRSKGEIPAITFVSFDTAMFSMFTDFGGEPTGTGAYESWFIKEFIPYIEDKYDVCRERDCRSLAGLSMGGFGALKTAIRFWNMFFMAAANSPALPPFSPWEPVDKWISYFNRHQVGALKGVPLLLQARRIFPNETIADNNDPSWLVEAFGDVSKLPKMYFDMGGNDYFGFDEGYHKLVNILDQRGVRYTTEFVPDADHDLFKTNRFKLLRFVMDSYNERGLQ